MGPAPQSASAAGATVPVEAVPACPVCGHVGGTPLHTGLRDRVFGVAPGAWDLVACPRCGTARLDPRPADAALGSLYASYYTHEPPRPNLAPTGLAGVLRRLRNAHVDATLGYDAAPALPGGRVLTRLLPGLGAVAERSVRSLPRGTRVLDVGCGNGLWVAEAAAAGWQAAGIDLDEAGVAAGHAAGLDLALQTAQERAVQTPGAFDAVTLSHVIEHVADPVDLLRAVHTLLKPGGRVWIATPNLQAAGHRRFGADWIHLDPPRHLVLFTGSALERALHAAGFAEVRPLRPSSSTARAWAVSAAVQAGVSPADASPDSSRALRLAAARADLAAQRRWGLAEELLVLARRP